MYRRTFLLWCLMAPLLWGEPQVMRSIQSDLAKPGQVVKVAVKVTFPAGEPLPKAFIIEENWPAAFRFVRSAWNGNPLTAADEGGEVRFFLGYGEGNYPVSSGELTYFMQVPEAGWEEHAAVSGKFLTSVLNKSIPGDGRIRWMNPDELPSAHLFCTVVPGWNLLSLPLCESQLDNMELLEGFFPECWILSAVHGADWELAAVETLEAGQPFWVYWERNEERRLLFMGEECDDFAGVPSAEAQWRLNNVASGSADAAVRHFWLWDNGRWHPAEMDGVEALGGGWFGNEETVR